MAAAGSDTPSVDPEIGPDGYRYNDDLLLNPAARKVAAEKHALVFHVLDHPELRDLFTAVDTPANRAKKASRAWGFWAVVMALLSLLAGAAAPGWKKSSIEPWSTEIAWGAAVLGLSSVLVAWAGLLHGPRKNTWLYNRLRTERMRQFHFQSFLSRFADVVASVSEVRKGSSVVAVPVYQKKRSVWFAAFTEQYERRPGETERQWRDRLNESLDGVIRSDPHRAAPVWLHGNGEEPRYPTGPFDPEDLNAVFRAYAALRFREQLNFVTHTLRPNNDSAPPQPATAPSQDTPISSSTSVLRVLVDTVAMPWFPGRSQPLRVWRKLLRALWYVSFAAVALFHFVLLCAPMFSALDDDPVWLHIGVLGAALVAVASRTLSEGFAVNRELARYEEYQAICSELFREFQSANLPPERKFELMVRMERDAFEEMREFLRSNREATFVF